VPGQAPGLVEHFARYIIREDVQVCDTTSERSYVLLAGDVPARSVVMAMAPTAAEGQAWLRRPLLNTAARLADVPLRWIRWEFLGPVFCGLLEVASFDLARIRQTLSDERFQATPCGEAALQTLRIEAGMPLFGVDFGEENFPQEVGRDREAISFTKGCYLGQETVARIDALGHVNKRLAGVHFFGSQAPVPGMELLQEGKKVGRVTSAAVARRLHGSIALAMVHREATSPGTRMESSVGCCEVVALPIKADDGGLARP
jgi:folate-binding protein YgfZ